MAGTGFCSASAGSHIRAASRVPSASVMKRFSISRTWRGNWVTMSMADSLLEGNARFHDGGMPGRSPTFQAPEARSLTDKGPAFNAQVKNRIKYDFSLRKLTRHAVCACLGRTHLAACRRDTVLLGVDHNERCVWSARGG